MRLEATHMYTHTMINNIDWHVIHNYVIAEVQNRFKNRPFILHVPLCCLMLVEEHRNAARQTIVKFDKAAPTFGVNFDIRDCVFLFVTLSTCLLLGLALSPGLVNSPACLTERRRIRLYVSSCRAECSLVVLLRELLVSHKICVSYVLFVSLFL